ncbi:MAG: hypothetical protein ACE5GT_03800, partial [Rhodospirillales bacterium]
PFPAQVLGVRPAMLERIAAFFYDPVWFWTVPLALAAGAAGWRRLRSRGRRADGSNRRGPGN